MLELGDDGVLLAYGHGERDRVRVVRRQLPGGHRSLAFHSASLGLSVSEVPTTTPCSQAPRRVARYPSSIRRCTLESITEPGESLTLLVSDE